MDRSALLTQAIQLFQFQNFNSARDIVNRLLLENKNDAEILNFMGVLEQKLNNTDSAINYFKKAIKENKNFEESYLNLGKLFKNEKRYNEAIDVLNKMASFSPMQMDCKKLLANIYINNNQYDKAELILKESLELDSYNKDILMLLSKLYCQKDKLQEALEVYKVIHSRELGNVYILRKIIQIYFDLQLFYNAEPYIDKLLRIIPLDFFANYKQALIYQLQNKQELLEKHSKIVIGINPLCYAAYYTYVQSKKFSSFRDDPYIATIVAYLNDKNLKNEERSILLFSLAKVHRDCHNYDASFYYYFYANKFELMSSLQKYKPRFELPVYSNYITKLLKIFNHKDLAECNIKGSNLKPIFIFGHSRTGKSIIEKMLTSNAHVKAAGEAGFKFDIGFSSEVPSNVSAETSNALGMVDGMIVIQNLKNINEEVILKIQEEYLKTIEYLKPNDNDYIIDTMPDNFKFLGFLKKLYPKAKFIYCKRNLEDVGINMYFSRYGYGHRFSYSLEDIGSYLKESKRYEQHWSDFIDKQAITVNYDDLVKEPLVVYTKIKQYLGFDLNSTPDTEEITTDDINISKKYAQYIQPLESALVSEKYLAPKFIDAEKLCKKANEYLALKKYKQVLLTLKQILDIEPLNLTALYLMSIVYYEQKEASKAKEIIEKILNVDNKNEKALIVMVAIMDLENKGIEAIKYIEYALEVNPHNKEARDNYKTLLHKYKLKANKQFEFNPDYSEMVKAVFKPELNIKITQSSECRYLLESSLQAVKPNETNVDSYTLASWDQYFKDLSYGAYRTVNSDGERSYRIRAWYYVLKNIALIDRIFNKKQENINILDIGCSSGYLRRFLEGNYSKTDKKRINYWGLDARKDMLQAAVSDIGNIESGASGKNIPSGFIAHDVKYGLPYLDQQFDIVVCFEMIKYLPKAQGQLLLKEINRVLKPKSELYLSTTTQEWTKGYMESLNLNENKKLLEDSGFNVIKTFGSQSKNIFLKDAIRPNHQELYHDLLGYYPEEIIAVIMAPLYPMYCQQITFYCQSI